LGLENTADFLKHPLAENAKIRAAMVHGRVVYRAQHPIRHIAGPRDLQEMAPSGGLGLEISHGGILV